MLDIFSDEVRRNPHAVYAQMRTASPTFYVPPPFDGWLVFNYDAVKWVLQDHETFSSRVPAPRHWFLFFDPPEHTKLRGLISKAFTPRMVAALEPRIRELTCELLNPLIERGEVDLATDFSIPLPMKIIAGMIGIPQEDWIRFKGWSDSIMRLSYARSGGPEAEQGMQDFIRATGEMNGYLGEMIAKRKAEPKEDLLTRLIEAEVDGERLTQEEILGFFQLLVVAGQETTTNLINNAMICLIDHPAEMARLTSAPEQMIPSMIEEVLRFRSPVQWVMRAPKRDVEVNAKKIPAGKLILAIIGSANRDEKQFPEPDRFDITRQPNTHIAFGHGIHSCLGAALARMEAKIAFTELLKRGTNFRFASKEPWEPRKALHVHGPTRLPLRFEPTGIGKRG